MNIAAYVWYSTEQQKRDSQANDREQIEQWANSNGYEQIEWFEDTSDNRESYKQLYETHDEYDVIVFRSLPYQNGIHTAELLKFVDIVQAGIEVLLHRKDGLIQENKRTFKTDTAFVSVTKEKLDNIYIQNLNKWGCE